MDSVVAWLDSIVGSSRELLIAGDLDGTLTQIREEPDGVLPHRRATAALTALSHATAVHMAVFSGRTLDSLTPRVAHLGPVWIASDHGSVVVDPFKRARIFNADAPPGRRDALKARADELARLFRGARVEVKAHGIALHYSDVGADKHDALVDMFRLACGTLRAKPLCGTRVVEGRFGGDDKGVALAYIMSRLPTHTAVLYVGCDATDEPALEFTRREPLGLALHLQSTEQPSPRVEVHGRLDGPPEWIEMLEAIATLRGRPRRAP